MKLLSCKTFPSTQMFVQGHNYPSQNFIVTSKPFSFFFYSHSLFLSIRSRPDSHSIKTLHHLHVTSPKTSHCSLLQHQRTERSSRDDGRPRRAPSSFSFVILGLVQYQKPERVHSISWIYICAGLTILENVICTLSSPHPGKVVFPFRS